LENGFDSFKSVEGRTCNVFQKRVHFEKVFLLEDSAGWVNCAGVSHRKMVFVIDSKD